MTSKRDLHEYDLGELGVTTGSAYNQMGYQERKKRIARERETQRQQIAAGQARQRKAKQRTPSTPEQKDQAFIFFAMAAAMVAMGYWVLSANWQLEWWGHAALIGGPALLVGGILKENPRLARFMRWASTAVLVVLVIGAIGRFMQ